MTKESFKLRNGKEINDYAKPYIIAEINTSHNGNMQVAKQMVTKAKEIGADCVKFQSWSAESLYSKTYYVENPIAKRAFTKFSFSEEELLEVANFSHELGIDFASTPYSRREVDFLLNECNAPFIKVASMDLPNYEFLEYIAKKGAPIILSTGMCDMQEIKKAVEIIESTRNTNFCLLHCISIYPPEKSTIRLQNIPGLRKEFPNYNVGFSDHSIGIEIPAAAIALGSCIIEKHFTLDKNKIGLDNQMASEPEEFEQMIKNCNNVQIAMGGEERIVFPAEMEQRTKMRRSIIAAKDLKAGDVIQKSDLDVKRPGNGIAPELISDLIGKTLKSNVEADTLLKKEDFL